MEIAYSNVFGRFFGYDSFPLQVKCLYKTELINVR